MTPPDAHLEKLMDELVENYEDNGAESDAYVAARQSLREFLSERTLDTQRLDWLESQEAFSGKWYYEEDGFNSLTMQFSVFPKSVDAETVREAIDELRRASMKEPE